jgi:hypothetical protein
LRCAIAPVNEPRSCPNSSESTSSGGSAPQLTRQNGPSQRSEPSWTMRDTTSLPTPVSPKSNTGRSLGATIATRSNTERRPPRAPMTTSSSAIC